MSDARNALLRKLAMAVGTYDRDKDVSLVDTYRAEVLREATQRVEDSGCEEVNWCGCHRASSLLRRMAEGETE